MHRFAFVIVAALTGCTSLLGVEDVELRAPDAGVDGSINAAVCDIDPRISLATSNPATSVIGHTDSGAPSLVIQLNADAKRDYLGFLLYDNMGGHAVLNTPGTYSLSAADAKITTCGICVTAYADYDSSTKMPSQNYFANATGSLTLFDANATRLHGRLQNLQLRHVDKSYNDVDDGCRVDIVDIEFDMTYPAE